MSDTLPTERYRVHAADATTIPDWLLLYNAVSAPARLLASVILYHQKNGDAPPTREVLAATLEVDTRSVARWIDELREEHLIEAERIGRRNVYGFLKPKRTRKGDRMITTKKITDLSVPTKKITDPTITDHSVTCCACGASQRHEHPIQDESVTLPHGGGGGHDHDTHHETPTPPPAAAPKRRYKPADITTDTGRWMVQAGFSVERACLCQHRNLDDCKADFARRWNTLGQRHGAISDAWMVEAPPTAADTQRPAQQRGELDPARYVGGQWGDLFKRDTDTEAEREVNQ